MSKPDDGGPAFPTPIVCDDEGAIFTAERLVDAGGIGMSLRDYFARDAMKAILGCPQELFKIRKLRSVGNERDVANVIADKAYGVADAMLLARKKKGGQDGRGK